MENTRRQETLNDWLKRTGVNPLPTNPIYPSSVLLAQSDVKGNAEMDLYQLSDYQVWAKSGGAIWLGPK